MNARRAQRREPLRMLLVPTDFSGGAEMALGRALLLPRSGGAAIHVIHVLPADIPAKARVQAAAAARRNLEGIVSHARDQARGARLDLTSEVLSGEPFVEIIRCSRSISAELIVIGRHGRRPVRDLFIGTTAERVIRLGDVAILAVNGKPTHPYRRPLIATDLRDTAARVFALALRVLGPAVTAAHVVHAFHVPFEGFFTPMSASREHSEYRRSFHERAKAGMAKLLARYEDTGIHWKTMVRAGDPRAVILAEAVRLQSDLIALGTHGRSGVAHALVGSVAEWVIAQARCDILVSRPVRFSFELP